ncbi:MAG: hypothetical protein ACJARS_003506 [bacterium]|jgi:hypothetical protein
MGRSRRLKTKLFVAHPDNDGASDSTELTDGADVLNPVWFATADLLAPGELLNVDNRFDGVATLP